MIISNLSQIALPLSIVEFSLSLAAAEFTPCPLFRLRSFDRSAGAPGFALLPSGSVSPLLSKR